MYLATSPEIKVREDMEHNYLPHYASQHAAGLDLCCAISTFILPPHSPPALVSTGVSINLGNRGIAGLLLPRSGLGHKHGIVLGNTIGLIDADYQGEVMVSLKNTSDVPFTVEKGMRIAQLLLLPVVVVSRFTVVKDFSSNTARGEGGFGSTGKS